MLLPDLASPIDVQVWGKEPQNRTTSIFTWSQDCDLFFVMSFLKNIEQAGPSAKVFKNGFRGDESYVEL